MVKMQATILVLGTTPVAVESGQGYKEVDSRSSALREICYSFQRRFGQLTQSTTQHNPANIPGTYEPQTQT
jgi:hypothetical protein